MTIQYKMCLISSINYVGASNSDDGNNVAMIVGIVAGVLIFITLIIIISIMLFRCRKSKLFT